MTESHQREAAIFDAAMELPPEQRAAHLDHACGEDAALRQRMESLLKADESSCGFLDSPNGEPVLERRGRARTDREPDRAELAAGPQPGQSADHQHY
jgi:hypothetical protein